jgi:hypothetical protein
MSTEKRQSIRLGPAVTAVLGAGHCAAPSVAKQLDILAGRYEQLIAATSLPSWPIAHWITYLTLARGCDLAHPGAHYAIQGAAKATAKTFAYTLEGLSQHQQIALLSLAERTAALPLEAEAIAPALANLGVPRPASA